jgi:hypothetical protein
VSWRPATNGKAPGCLIAFCRVLERPAAITATLHELGHLLPYSPPLDLSDIPEATQMAALRDWHQQQDRAVYEMPRIVPPWHPTHDRRFIRIVLHLWWRAAIHANVVADLGGLCAGLQYGLSPALWYWRLLGDEPLRLRDATFEEILAEPEPQPFVDLWRSDVSRWMKANPEAVSEISDAI